MSNANLVFTRLTLSDSLSFEDVLARLKSDPRVDGIALFGSRMAAYQSKVSDFDLLIVIDSPTVSIFQLLTHIEHRMADVALVSTHDADRVVSGHNTGDWTSVQRLFMLKMRNARIVYDRAERLRRAQLLAQALDAAQQLTLPSSYESIYSAWFWENFSLLHIKRMAQSEDSVYQTATDMMLLTSLSGICRDYFVVRSLPWEGEKAAIRYFETHDPSFLAVFRECMACQDRRQKIALFERLVALVMEPPIALWSSGTAAVFLTSPPQSQADVEQGLIFWEALIS